ncbi:hypothetical protein GF342_01100 [Candidatus Woesearchaeota archaeon]|nr:hypothetical protein [Candidatus Woesearchaeota archaeon]
MSIILAFIQGFAAKIITGADDSLTHIPLISSLTKKRSDRLFFIAGMLLSIVTLIVLSVFFARLLTSIPYRHLISSALLVALAIFIYIDKFAHFGRERFAKFIASLKRTRKRRLFTYAIIGYFAFFATGIDDVIVYSSILVHVQTQFIIAAGILTASIVQFIIIFYLSAVVRKIKHIENITIIGLLVLALLIGLQII